jgi:hypothetical protein
MPRGRKACHVCAGLGDNDLGGAQPDPGDGLEPRDDVGTVGGELHDPFIEGGDRLVEPVDVVEQLTQLHRMMLGEAAVERPDEFGDLGTHPPVGHLGQHRRVAPTRDQRLDHVAARLGQRRGGHRPELDHRFSELEESRTFRSVGRAVGVSQE